MNAIVIGAAPPAGLVVPDCAVLPDRAAAHFDSDTETWTVTASDGLSATASVVVDSRRSSKPVIARHGIPNYFRIPGPDVARQSRYVHRCLQLVERSGAARIEARGTVVLHRWRPQPVAPRFHLTGAQPDPDDLYDGPAMVDCGGRSTETRVRLIGHLDAIDGRYHWQGTVFSLPRSAPGRPGAVVVTIEGRSAAARVIERTPWGTHMIAGFGEPPFG